MAREAILHRTVRVENRNDRFRFADFNVVNTSIGACWEPRSMKVNYGEQGDIDLDDCINRIDKIDIDFDWRDCYHRGEDGNALIGGFVVTDLLRSFSDDAV